MPSEKAMNLVREIARILDDAFFLDDSSLERAAAKVDEALEEAFAEGGYSAVGDDEPHELHDPDDDYAINDEAEDPDLDDPTEAP